MRVALAQIDCTPGDVAANVRTMLECIRDAAGQRCDAVWFPELSDTGYVLSQIPEIACAWPGHAHDALAAAAKRCQIVVGAGLSERVGDRIFNSLAVFNPAGQRIGHYRKAHLFAAGEVNEAACFTPAPAPAPGSNSGSDTGRRSGLRPDADHFPLADFHVGLSICYDLRFPELYRQRTADGATALINATAWPAARSSHWDILTRARAIENQCYFLGVGRVGEDEGLRFAGRSRVVTPTGDLLAEASATEPELLIADLDPKAVTNFRDAVPALGARRRDLFA